MEFGEGILPRLIYHFCDSPYLSPRNYTHTLHQLLDIFYHFKNESLERLPDDILLEFMKQQFDGPCQGSLEYLQGTSLERLAQAARSGSPLSAGEEELPEGDEEA